jgi:molecular chaperone DnaK
MVKNAEEHAAEDKAKREEVETRNRADSLIYATEKTLKEYGDKVDESDKKDVEDAIENLRQALAGSDAGAIESAMESLTRASQKMAEAMYAQATAQQEAETQAGQQETEEQEPPVEEEEDVTEAEYEVVDEDSEKKEEV